MDLLTAVRSYVAVARRQGFSAAAQHEGTTQPVVSRRVAALEGVVGGALFERSSRQVRVTALGAALLPRAHDLLRAEQSLLEAAAAHHRGALRLLVPPDLDPAAWAAVQLRARGAGHPLELVEAGRDDRAVGVDVGEADGAVVAVDSGRADWLVPLGLARDDDAGRPATLASLHPTRADGAGTAPRLVVLPEDAAPALLAPLRRAAARHGLTPGQVHEAPGLVPALTGVLAGDDLLLCSARQARAWGLVWSAAPRLGLARAYRLAAVDPSTERSLRRLLSDDVGAALGAGEAGAA